MTTSEIIVIVIGIISLLISVADFIIELLSFLRKKRKHKKKA